MADGASIATIKAGLIAAYQLISLPGGLGVPTAIGREMDGVPPSLPYVEIYTNPSISITQASTSHYNATRRFIVRLYVAKLSDDKPSIKEPLYVLGENCVEAVEDYFNLNDAALNVYGVEGNRIVADTGATFLFTRANKNYAGVAFDHEIKYLRRQ